MKRQIAICSLILFSIILMTSYNNCGKGFVSQPLDLEGRKRIFISSNPIDTDFLSLSTADNFCVTAARNVGISSSWIAWLSRDGVDAISRVNDVGPWYSMDQKTLLFATRAQMTSAPTAAIEFSETGINIPSGSFYWTGTSSTGVSSGANCNNWSVATNISNGEVGKSGVTSTEWSSSTTAACDSSLSILCIEQ